MPHPPRSIPVVAAVSLLALGCHASTEPALTTDAGQRADGGAPSEEMEDGGDAPQHGGDAGDDAGEPTGPAFDASALDVDGEPGDALCRLSEDGRTLRVSVTNRGTTETYAAAVRLESAGSGYELRVNTPTLAPGASAELTFPRSSVGGFVEDWQFTVTVDPDGRHGAPHAPVAGRCQDLRSRARAGMVPIWAWYDQNTGLWNGNDWWTSANQLETVIDYTRDTGDASYLSALDNTFEKNKAEDFDKWGYYDDDGWWAMAWIKAYDLTHQTKYLDMAKAIFRRMTNGWTDQCGGGIYWASPRAGDNGNKNKNAIPNSLFLQVAAKLHQRTPGDGGAGSFLDWAEREWAWFANTGMLDDRKLVVDGLNNLTDCQPGGPVFTYNTGVLLGGLVDLAAAKGDASLLDEALAIARATIANMNEGGILKETPCGGDICTQFKGIFMRNLAHLYDVRPEADLLVFMRRQSDHLWGQNRSAEDQFSYEWHLPFDRSTPSRQSSALDALLAAVSSSNQNLALLGSAAGSAPCSASEGADRAIDGNARSKWCAGGANGQTLTLNLGAARNIVGFRVRHAGAGGENGAWNTRDFELETSVDGQTWTPAVTVTGNTADVTDHPIVAVRAQHVRLHVTSAQTATDFVAARIYELEVLGAGLD